MDLKDCFVLEDLFPMSIADHEERPFGILFYNMENKDSWDSNHALIYRDRISDLPAVLQDIRTFYEDKGICPIIYQSTTDRGYFEEIREQLDKAGFKSWTEEQRFMVLTEENTINPNKDLTVIKAEEWDESYTSIFLEAEEPWEIEVVKRSMEDPDSHLWVAYLGEKPIGYLNCKTDRNVCRLNYLLVSKLHRNVGAGRTLCFYYVEWCKAQGISKAFLWPAGEHPEKIYYEGGFRLADTVQAGRAFKKAE